MRDRTLVPAGIMVAGAMLLALVATGQEKRQEWSMKYRESDSKVRFRIERHKGRDTWSSSMDVPLTAFEGLSRSDIERGNAVKFEYVQDAGRLICQGSFSWSGGSGTFTFAPNPQFAAELKKLGYDAPTDEQMFGMMMQGAGLELAQAAQGLHATTQDLVELAIHGVKPAYIRAAQDAGYRFTARDYVEMKIHGVETAFLRDLKGSGYDLPARDIIELKIHGVNSEFMSSLKDAGYDLPAHQITELKIHGVSPEYVQDLKAYGLTPTAADIVEMKIHGVTPEYLKGLKDAGFDTLRANNVVSLKNQGVSAEFVRETAELGYHFTPQELVGLRIHGVDGGYLRHLRDAGMKNLSAAQIETLKIHGVE